MKPGDLVKIKEDERFDDSGLIGLLQWVSKDYPYTCGIMISGEFMVYRQQFVEVISEAG